ncbi:MAG: hypothetical protein K6U00_13300 [Armatimonadetes bacterium]|nr:hypothetical protein [Armatimonadota bacterium]
MGFRGPVYTDSIPYRRFFEIFWKGVCKDHSTVGEAIRRAKRSMRPWLLRIFKVTPSYPEVWGENTRLYPAAYGR